LDGGSIIPEMWSLARSTGKSSDRILTSGFSLIASVCSLGFSLAIVPCSFCSSVLAAEGGQSAAGAAAAAQKTSTAASKTGTSSLKSPASAKPAVKTAPAVSAIETKTDAKSVVVQPAKAASAAAAQPSKPPAAAVSTSVAKPAPAAMTSSANRAEPSKESGGKLSKSTQAPDAPAKTIAQPAKNSTARSASDAKSDTKAEAKAEPKIDSKAETKTAHVHVKAHPAPALVPPPPPDTPTMIPSFGDDSTSLMPMEYMSPELVKKRRQDLVAQLADAKTDLKQKQDDIANVQQRAEQFKTLFEEGVISKRELEAAQKDASEIDSSVNRARLRVSELQTLLDGVNGRWDQINNKNKKKAVVIKRLSDKSSRIH
jgi:hypothetical protein